MNRSICGGANFSNFFENSGIVFIQTCKRANCQTRMGKVGTFEIRSDELDHLQNVDNLDKSKKFHFNNIKKS